MKNIIKAFLGAACVLMTGCTDLDVNVESQYTSIPKEAIVGQMADLYNQMRDCFGRRYMEVMTLSSDEHTAIAYGSNWYDSGAYAHPSLHNYNFEDATLDWYNVAATGIVKANEIIASEAVEYHASARAMRAFFTFILMDCWGDTPIIDPVANTDDLSVRQPRAKVAEYLESELKAIIPLLTDEVSAATYGTPTKYMAQALLAKLYINWGVYTCENVEDYDAATTTNEKLNDCIAVCDDIIKSRKFSLGSMPYRMKFAPNNGPHVEDFIYVMPYDTYEAQGMQYGRSRSWRHIKDVDKCYFGSKMSNSGGGYIALTPEFSSLFCLDGDQRNTCVIGGPVYIYDPETLLPTEEPAMDKDGVTPLVLNKEIKLVETDPTINVGDDVNGARQGWRSVKFFVVDSDYKNGRNQSNDLPIFRYADILLMKAEAIVRGGSKTSTGIPGCDNAKDLFNQIRSYVSAPTIAADPSLKDILDERGREFLDENWRRNDMIRFGTYESEFFPHYKDFPTARFDKSCRIFPLHKNILNIHKEWKQNRGYAALNPDQEVK